MTVSAVSLLSGGLDSLLATRLVQDQGVKVTGLQFISPFFGSCLKWEAEEAVRRYKEHFEIDAKIIDLSEEYLGVVGSPDHGYGKNFNPCIDCKIFLFKKALDYMRESGASFLITGEVVGQRPMSQRRYTMDLIANKMGAKDILLRPLCAKALPPTLPEREGWVDRQKLMNFSGRSRKPQMALAKELGIDGYPAPAGGCVLTDPILSGRISRYFAATAPEKRSVSELLLLLSGRPFRFPGGSILTTGRSEGENNAMIRLAGEGDLFVKVPDIPGPLGIFRQIGEVDERALAASVVLRYSPKSPEEYKVGVGVRPEPSDYLLTARKATDEELETYRV